MCNVYFFPALWAPVDLGSSDQGRAFQYHSHMQHPIGVLCALSHLAPPACLADSIHIVYPIVHFRLHSTSARRGRAFQVHTRRCRSSGSKRVSCVHIALDIDRPRSVPLRTFADESGMFAPSPPSLSFSRFPFLPFAIRSESEKNHVKIRCFFPTSPIYLTV